MLLKNTPYIIELLTPKQSDESFEQKLEVFAQRYRRILDHDAVVSICDNPLGNIHFTAMEVVGFLGLPLDPECTLLHLNSFHRKIDFDLFLHYARERGLGYLLVVSGDGGPRLTRLEPSELGIDAKTVTAVELLRYIERGVKKPETSNYDPKQNLARIHDGFSAFGIYLSQLGFKRPWEDILTRMPLLHKGE